MSVSKFRFVSPGVFVNEIDNSQLPREAEEMGPVIIGRSLRGPMMRPVRVQSFSDFVDVFGNPIPGGTGGDVWRDGNKLTPTYAPYAAQTYLANSSPVTFIRLGGYQYLGDSATNGLAGWETPKAYGLFVAPTSGSGASTTVNGLAPLAAIIYATGSIGLSGKGLASLTDNVANASKTWVKLDNNNLELRVVAGGLTSSVNFDDQSKKYIRSVLNTTPSLYSDKNYFLGETFLTFVKEKLGSSVTATENYAAILLELVDHSNFRKNAGDANSDSSGNATLDNYAGWVVSQHTSVSSSMTASANGTYASLQNLFKVVGLTEGEWNSQNVKVSIEDIKLPPNQFIKYGTFTLSLRKMDDTDTNPVFLERFTGLNLDPSSENYIAKKIGDKYSEWDYEKSAFVEYGMYDNNSKFIRVQMNQDIDNALLDPALLPFGYYGPVLLTTGSVSGTNGYSITTGFLSGNVVTAGNAFTASFNLPTIPNYTDNSYSPVSSKNALYWGLKTNVSASKKHNQDILDLVRAKPVDYATLGGTAKVSYLFSLDDVSGSVVNGALDKSAPVSWAEGNRAAGASLTTNTSSFDGITGLLQTFNKFTMPLVGGFDGLNILKADPFANSLLAVANGDHTTNYAFNSVKVAIESVADAEVVEMNLAAVPGIYEERLTNLLIEKCETRGDALAVIDLEGDYNPEAATNADKLPVVQETVDALKNRTLNSSYGCAFFPWVMVRDTISNKKLWMPPSVIALGTFSSSQKKTELWFAPAGFNRGGLTDGSAGLPVLQTSLRLSSKDRDALYEANINPIATFPAEGIVIFGQKTLQVTPSALDRINVRRLMIYLKKEISRMASTVLFDPNTEVTWNRFLNQAQPFLASVQSRFGLSEYRIILDNTTTTPDLVDRNIVYAKILLKPTRAIEFIALDFVISNTGASFAD